MDQPELVIEVSRTNRSQQVAEKTSHTQGKRQFITNQHKPKETFIEPKQTPAIKRVPFNPNTANQSLLLQLGFSTKLAQTLINYRNKGGRFYQKEDLKKIYGLNSAFYDQLAPYILIENNTSFPQTTTQSISIDINQADTITWQQLYGIGPTFSRRIVKFRDKLGGFYSIDQVAETYGLPDSTYKNIRSQLQLSPLLRKIVINQINEEALKAHPYISWKQARTMIMYRNNHGAFENLEAVEACMAFNKAELEKLKPYLSFE